MAPEIRARGMAGCGGMPKLGERPHAKANTAALAAIAAAIDLGPDAPPVELCNQSAHGALLVTLAGLFVPAPLMSLEILVGLVQAYIFTVLATVFIGAAAGAAGRT